MRFDTGGREEQRRRKKLITLGKHVVETHGVVAKVGDVDSRVRKVGGCVGFKQGCKYNSVKEDYNWPRNGMIATLVNGDLFNVFNNMYCGHMFL